MAGRVVGIHVAPSEGAPMQAVSGAECRTDHGLVGDRYAKAGSKGQVTIVSAEQLAEAARRLGAAIAPGATRRNVTIEGIPMPSIGERLRLGDVLVEIAATAAPCDLMNTCIGPGARDALVGLSGMRARVLGGGMLRVGDAVRLERGQQGLA